MRRATLCLALTALAGCARSDQPAEGAASAMVVPAGTAGTWSVRGYNPAGDSIVAYQLVATGDTAGWTIRFPDREPIPVRVVAAGGDSVVTDAGPYESILRPGVQVSTHGVFRVRGDSMFGMTTARYSAGPDTVLQVRSVGTRMQ